MYVFMIEEIVDPEAMFLAGSLHTTLMCFGAWFQLKSIFQKSDGFLH
jgi:hypothetical protein